MAKTQIELIAYYTKELEKTIKSHGLGSDFFYNSTFLLKGVQMGIPLKDLFKWVSKKMEDLHTETLKML
jgi:hypothetical protein